MFADLMAGNGFIPQFGTEEDAVALGRGSLAVRCERAFLDVGGVLTDGA
jgi:hypothetical protein